MQKKYKFGIALSGGGVRGVAHIGVLEALREHDLAPEVVIGTSAGAIIGALYAADKTTDEMMEFVRQWSLYKVIKVGFPIDGLTSLSFLQNQLLQAIEHDSFKNLQKPLYVGATNLNTGKLEIIQEGSLSEVVTASSSIPLVFKPMEINGQIYVDGGLMCNMPINPVREDCEMLLGVNLIPSSEVSTKSLQNVLAIGTRTFNLGILINSKSSLEQCDLVIEPKKLNKYNVFTFGKRQQKAIYEIGYEATIEKIPEIKAKLEQTSLESTEKSV